MTRRGNRKSRPSPIHSVGKFTVRQEQFERRYRWIDGEKVTIGQTIIGSCRCPVFRCRFLLVPNQTICFVLISIGFVRTGQKEFTSQWTHETRGPLQSMRWSTIVPSHKIGSSNGSSSWFFSVECMQGGLGDFDRFERQEWARRKIDGWLCWLRLCWLRRGWGHDVRRSIIGGLKCRNRGGTTARNGMHRRIILRLRGRNKRLKRL